MADEAETVERKKKSKVSEREVLGNDGKPQDEYIGAAGASYKVISEDFTAAVMFDELPDDVVNGLAAFGWLTLAGNVTNAVRNGENRSGETSEKEALQAWLDNLKNGDWSKPTGELEAGVRLLAEGYARARADAGSPVDVEQVFAKLKAADKDKRKAVRSDPHVAKAIAQIQLERKAERAKASATTIVDL